MSIETQPYRYEAIALSNESTVVAEFLPDALAVRETGYQSEAALESAFIEQLQRQAYEYLTISSEAELVAYHRARAEGIAQRFAERARSEGLEANCDVVQGRADDRIVDRVQDFDLLVMGRDSEASDRRGALIGSTTDAVIRKTSKSTIVVPAGAPLTGPIVLGFDGSPGSRVAAQAAVPMANGLNEQIHVFVDSKDKGRALARFEEVRQLLSGVNQPIRETSSTLGRPDVKLVDTARETRAGLVVMGAYGRNRITDYFLGSNAAAVVRTSPVAVLLAR